MRLPEARVLRKRLALGPRRQPWNVLVPLVLAQWLFLVLLVRSVEHNGWLFYQGGDETHYYTSAWSLANGELPRSIISFGWSYLTAPIAGLAGANILEGLPFLVLLQTIVLLPLALVAVYGIAARIAGRAIGYFTAVCWVVVPYLAIPLFDPRYHQKYVELFLPQALGLTAMGDFPSMVCVLGAAYFAVTSLDTNERLHVGLAGLLTGFAIAIKPGNAPFLAAPVVAYLLVRRWRTLLEFGVAMLPPVLALTLWKFRVLGYVPLFQSAGPSMPQGPASLAAGLPGPSLSKYVHIDFEHLDEMKNGFREFFYSDRLVEVPFLAGLVGIARLSWAKSAFVAAWLLAFVIVKGSSDVASVETGSLFRLIMPGFPAFVVACAALPLLVPRVGPRLAGTFPVRRFVPLPLRDWRVVVPAIVLGAVPIVLLAALPVQGEPTAVTYRPNNVLIPVDGSFRPTADAKAGAVSLAWPVGGANGTRVFYKVFRSPTAGAEGMRCSTGKGAADCLVSMGLLGTTRSRSFEDRVRAGRWTYRVGLAANWIDDPTGGDVLALSPPLHVVVP